MYDYLVLDSISADGEIKARVRLAPALQDTSQMLHIGAAALLVWLCICASLRRALMRKRVRDRKCAGESR